MHFWEQDLMNSSLVPALPYWRTHVMLSSALLNLVRSSTEHSGECWALLVLFLMTTCFRAALAPKKQSCSWKCIWVLSLLIKRKRLKEALDGRTVFKLISFCSWMDISKMTYTAESRRDLSPWSRQTLPCQDEVFWGSGCLPEVGLQTTSEFFEVSLLFLV